MATSLLRLGRLGSLKCLRQDSWGTLRTPLTAALCTKTEGPKKPAKKAKAATLEASDERASLLAYKTAVAFPTRLSAPGFVSALSESVPSSDSVTAETVRAGSTQTASTEEINDPAPTLTTAVSEAVPETPPEPPKAAPSEEVTDVAPEVAVAEPAPSTTEVSAEASTTGEVASSNQGESATKQPEATPVAESVAGNDASSKTVEAGEATGSGAAKNEEATSSSSSSSESDSDSDSDSDDEGPDKSEKTKVVGQPEEKAGQEKVPTDSSSEVKATEAVASESVAVPESSEKGPPEAVIEPVTEATPSTTTEGSTQTASTEEINDPAPTLTTAVSEAVPETPPEPPKAAVSEEVTDVAPEVKTEAADEIVTEKVPGVEVKTSEAKTEAVPEAVSVAEVIPEAKAMPDVEAIPEASDKAAADTAEVPDIQAKAEPEIILDSAEEVPSEPIAEAVAAPPAEMLVDTAPTIADAGEPSPEAEVAAAPEEPAPEPEPEPFDNTTYKNLQHHSYNIYTFVDMDVEMAKHRLPQPSSGRPSPRD